MAKTQKSLFDDHSRKPAGSPGLLLVAQPGRPLTPAQREFNRLIAKIDDLRKRLERETQRLDNALAYHGEHIHPRRQRVEALRKELVRAFAPFLEDKRFKQRHDRRILKEIIGGQLHAVSLNGPIEEPDLLALFKRVMGVDFETMQQRKVDEMREAMESMFEDIGIDVNLSDFRHDMTPEEAAVKAAEMSEKFQKKIEAEQEASSRPGRSQSKRQLKREARMRQVEEMRKKSIASIYKQLAKVLHPDLEQDPALRERKVTLMQDLTTAYRNNDLHTLLRLELEWIQHEEGDLGRLTDEKLAIYNDVLKEQIAELKLEIEELPFHPRYQPIIAGNDPFDMRPQTDGRAEAHQLDRIIRDLERTLQQMKTGDAASTVRAAIGEYRAMSRRRPEVFDPPF